VLKVKEAVPPEGVRDKTVWPEVPKLKLLPEGISALKIDPETVIESASEPERMYKVVDSPDRSTSVLAVKRTLAEEPASTKKKQELKTISKQIKIAKKSLKKDFLLNFFFRCFSGQTK